MQKELGVLDLFSGIGGFALGLKRAGGFRTVAYCEIEPYRREVLLHRMRDGWLDSAPIWPDIRNLAAIEADVICGGFPCKNISNAGDRSGLSGEHSGLWSEMLRTIRVVGPRIALVENVAALNSRGMGELLGDLASIGYDAEWDCVPACAVGACHERDRAFVLAYPEGEPQRSGLRAGEPAAERWRRSGDGPSQRSSQDVPDTFFAGLEGHEREVLEREEQGGHNADSSGSAWWSREPGLARLAHGIPDQVERTSALGDSVVPKL